MSKREIIQMVLVEQRESLLTTARHFAKTHAEDLYQETALHVLQKADRLHDTVNVLGWVRKNMYHLFINQYRRQKHHEKYVATLDTEALLLEQLPVEECNLAAKILNELPEHYRVVLDAVLLKGMSYQEAAEYLHVPLGTIMSRKARALLNLRRHLSDHPELYKELECAAT